MISDCEAHKIDMVITKSISRFARNTQDCLEHYRKLKSLGVTLVFEKENINSADTTGELLLTILSSLAQDESRNISENTKWGIRSKFQKGIPHINAKRFLGFDMGKDGKLIVNQKQAKTVQRIYREYLEGGSYASIAQGLTEDRVLTGDGKKKWYAGTVKNMLMNERYMGDSLLQKSYTSDFLTKKLVKNDGQITQFYVQDSHPGIIPKNEWKAVQQEIERRRQYREEHKITQESHGRNTNPYFNKIICGACGRAYNRLAHQRTDRLYWQCSGSNKELCDNHSYISESTINRIFTNAWNQVVENRGTLEERWKKDEKRGNELQTLRIKQIRNIAEQGPIAEPFPEIIRAVLEYILVKDEKCFEVHFLEGTALEVKF